MSLSALTRAVRNHLRTNLTNFYDSDNLLFPGRQELNRKNNCRVMPDHHPVADCGQEFIAIHGSELRPTETDFGVAIEESFGLTVSVTRKISRVPKRHRGELGYILDDDEFTIDWTSIEARCRQIVGMVDKNYTLMQTANSLMDVRHPFIEPLRWLGTDPAPKQVDATHFCAYHVSLGVRPTASVTPLGPAPEADEIYGLLMQIRFGRAIRFQRNDEYDILGPQP